MSFAVSRRSSPFHWPVFRASLSTHVCAPSTWASWAPCHRRKLPSLAAQETISAPLPVTTPPTTLSLTMTIKMTGLTITKTVWTTSDTAAPGSTALLLHVTPCGTSSSPLAPWGPRSNPLTMSKTWTTRTTSFPRTKLPSIRSRWLTWATRLRSLCDTKRPWDMTRSSAGSIRLP